MLYPAPGGGLWGRKSATGVPRPDVPNAMKALLCLPRGRRARMGMKTAGPVCHGWPAVGGGFGVAQPPQFENPSNAFRLWQLLRCCGAGEGDERGGGGFGDLRPFWGTQGEPERGNLFFREDDPRQILGGGKTFYTERQSRWPKGRQVYRSKICFPFPDFSFAKKI
ncbi:hypothetical protein TNIN_24131 [Trichonephila inaurata madagascariensis]|uniref:Uncharacterized protein n=1 Tax=Trichonephila inaurata madagascariensis TaxID=2747483 RepID=A0A8X6YBP4_9ARAC|nr:hypothetical protein TNIN_24131 [Trichonephila inaurata madagascariensis]